MIKGYLRRSDISEGSVRFNAATASDESSKRIDAAMNRRDRNGGFIWALMGCCFFKGRVSPPPPAQQQQQHSSGGGDYKSTLLVNDTSDTIVIREKNRAVWGRDFYTIEANSSKEVSNTSECGTFVWMGVQWGARPTGLTIGFDELDSWQRVVFSAPDGRLSMFKVERERR